MRHGIERILTAGRLAGEVAAAVRARRPGLQIDASDDLAAVTAERVAEADAFAGFAPPACGLAGIGWIHTFGAGVDGWITSGALPPGCVFTRTVGRMGTRMAEYCLGWLISWFHGHDRIRDARAGRQWTPFEPRDLAGTTVGVAGTGAMGSAVASALRAQGVRTVGFSRTGTPRPEFETVYGCTDLDAHVAGLDALILALPLTAETVGLVGSGVLERARGLHLINVGRGATLDEDALLDAVAAGRVARAALDVFRVEPLPADSPLWSHDSIEITPHVAALTTVEDAAEDLLASLEQLEAGEPPALSVEVTRGY